MVIGLPRSGTTWTANWLTTDTTLCIHDPLYKFHYSDFDRIPSKKTLGIACTGLYAFPDFVNSHPARKVILRRNINEINDSLEKIGVPFIHREAEEMIDKLNGWHVNWDVIFKEPQDIYEFLLQKPFDFERHKFLNELNIQPNFETLIVDKSLTKKFMEEFTKGQVN